MEPSERTHIWQYDDVKPAGTNAVWKSYDVDLQLKLWRRYDEDPGKALHHKTKGWTVIVDLQNKTQTNPNTGKVRDVRCVEKIATPEHEPIPDEIPAREKFSAAEKKQSQVDAYKLRIGKIQEALSRGPDDPDVQELGGVEKAIESCADKMMTLAQLEHPKWYMNRQDAVSALQKNIGTGNSRRKMIVKKKNQQLVKKPRGRSSRMIATLGRAT